MLTLTKLVVGLLMAVGLFIWAMRMRDNGRGSVESRPSPGRFAISILALVAFLIFSGGVGTVEEGERGVVLRFGRATGRVLSPGLYATTPFIESVETMPVRILAESVKAAGASKDLQIVHAEITVNYSLIPSRAVEVYSTLGHSALPRIIKPAIEEAVKAGTAEYKAEELITHRGAVKDRIHEILRQRLEPKGFLLDAISITDFDFSETFNRSIEAKVTATQEALKAENDLQRVKAEAQQQVARAQAEAEALKAQRDAVTPELIELRRVEALLKSLEKWDGRLPYYVSAGTGQSPVPVLDVFRNAPK